MYLFTALCSLDVPSAHNHLAVVLAFSHFSVISVFLLTEAHLILSKVDSQYFYLGWVLLWPRWFLRMSPLNFCLDEFEICFALLSLKTDYDQAFAQYFHSNLSTTTYSKPLSFASEFCSAQIVVDRYVNV